MAGLFLAMEGVDGAGKTTQLRLLADYLSERKIPHHVCREPGGTSLGERVRSILLDPASEIALRTEMLLYQACRAQIVDEVIRPALAADKVVLCDRFLLSTIVYQGYAGGLPIETIRDVGRIATGGLLPDLSIVLDLSLAEARARRAGQGDDRIERRGEAYFEKVRAGFLEEARLNPTRIVVVPSTRDVKADATRIAKEVERVLYHARP